MKHLATLLIFIAFASTAWCQKLETSSDITTGYHDGLYYNTTDQFFTSIDGVLYAVGYSENSDRWTLVKYPANRSETTYTVHSKCYRIGRGAFEGAKNLQYINIPKQVRYIGDNAFDGCTSLIAINYGENGSSHIEHIDPDPADSEAHEVARYNMAGQPCTATEKGVQIVVYSDFTAKTVVVE